MKPSFRFMTRARARTLAVCFTAALAPATGCGAKVLDMTSTDTGNPPFVDLGKLSTDTEGGTVTVTGEKGAASPGGSVVTVTNQRTGKSVSVKANADGSFSVAIAAEPGDQLEVEIAGGEHSVLLLVASDDAGTVRDATVEDANTPVTASDAQVAETSESDPLDAACSQGRPERHDIWTDESDAIEVEWFSFWSGGYTLSLSRESMTDEQLRLVSEFRTSHYNCGCVADGAEVQVTIHSAGRSEEYAAISGDYTCDSSQTYLSYPEVKTFLDTAGCLSAKGYTLEADAGPRVIHPGSGCGHGLFNSGPSENWSFQVEVTEPGVPHQISVSRCLDRQLDLVLWDTSGNVELATATGTGGECPSLTHTFEAAGSYQLEVIMNSGEYRGDFYLSVELGEE
jgi:hypothetical protein